MKVQAHNSVEPPLEYDQDQTSFMNQDELTILGVTEILCSFRLVPEGKTGKDTRLIKIRVLRKVFSKQFCLSDAEDNTCSLLNTGGIADFC